MKVSSPRIRPAARSDAQAIRTLIWQVGINPIGLSWTRFLVAVDETDRVIACGQIKPHSGGVRELASIAVVPAWRGQGLAQAIIQQLMAQAGSPLYLTCRAELGGFYARFGFVDLTVAHQMPFYFRAVFVFTRLLNKLFSKAPKLLVMGWH